MSKNDFAGVVDVLVARAKELRAAGVQRIAFGEMTVDLYPAEPVESADDESPTPLSPSDALDDPALYGGHVPWLRERDR